MKIGFDFGTSFSALAVFREGKVQRIKFDGDDQFRTAIYFPPYVPNADQFVVDDHIGTIEARHALLAFGERKAKDEYRKRVGEAKSRISRQAMNDPAGYTVRGELVAKYKTMLEEEINTIPVPRETDDAEKRREAIELVRRDWFESETNRERVLGNLEESQLEEAVFGNAAVEAYLGDDRKGLLLYNPKAFLAHDLSPKIVAALQQAIGSLFRKVATAVEQQFPQEKISGVVIGRPVHFSRKQSETDNNKAVSILSRAAELAGMPSVAFMYEPGAASYQFHVSQKEPVRALVVDLGGGTADVSLVSLGGEADAPIPHYQQGCLSGGNDVDKALNITAFMPYFGKGQEVKALPALNAYFAYAADVQHIQYQKEFRDTDIRLMPEPFRQRMQRLKEVGNTIRLNRLAEESKIELGLTEQSTKIIDFAGEEHAVHIDVGMYERAISDYFEKLEKLLGEFAREKFDVVFLTGGMSRAKGVEETIRRVFPDKSLTRSESTLDVVSGLAIYAAQQ